MNKQIPLETIKALEWAKGQGYSGSDQALKDLSDSIKVKLAYREEFSAYGSYYVVVFG